VSAQQLPRRALLWLLLALLAAIGPHASRLPLWVLGVVGLALFWRLRVYQGRWSFAPRTLKVLLVIMAFVAVAIEWRTLIGLEPAVALLVIASGLKCMELRATRDVLVIGFVGYFLVASQLLFEQEIQYAAYALFALGVVTAALVARHQGTPAPGFPHPLALAARMFLQALPVMLVLFVVFPRIAPLWSMPQNKSAARTGPSDFMAPGDIARLSGSSELAFRATFEGDTPPQRDLYWRGLVFSDFDGREWRPGALARTENEYAERGVRYPGQRTLPHVARGPEVSYELILEPSNRVWAYVLGYPLQFDEGLRLGGDYRLYGSSPISQRMRYRVRSDIGAVLEPDLRVLRRHAELKLPDGFNPRTLALAQQWRAEEGSDAAFIQRVLEWFNREAFVYTLSPPLLGRDSVDDFLFQARRGFCEHYASAFVVLLRAAGVPARVVVGYQGGERNPYQDYLLVHQFDAHAWAEAWLDGQGWVRFDPTFAVAPQRIESGLSGALGDEFLAGSPLAMERYQHVRLIGWIRMRWDLATYQWARLVLSYDTGVQVALLNRLLGEISPQRLVAALLLCGSIVLGLVALSLFGWHPGRRHDAATRAYLAACRRLERYGLGRRHGEAPFDYAQRVAASRPLVAAEFMALSETFVQLCFAGATVTEQPELRRSFVRRARAFRG
jgi:protein-glutamine gamma-glutamyltransferase